MSSEEAATAERGLFGCKRPWNFMFQSPGLLLTFIKALFLFLASASSVKMTKAPVFPTYLYYLKINEQRSCMISQVSGIDILRAQLPMWAGR